MNKSVKDWREYAEKLERIIADNTKAYEELKSELSAFKEGIKPEDAKSPADGAAYIVKLKSVDLKLIGVRRVYNGKGIWSCTHPLISSGVRDYLDSEICTAYPLPQQKEES